MRLIALLVATVISFVLSVRMLWAAEPVHRLNETSLTARVPSQAEVRAGRDAELKVEVYNQSKVDIVLTDESELRSYDLEVRTPTGGKSYAGVGGGGHDTDRGRRFCPADGSAVLLRPSQKTVRVIKVPVPSGATGTLRVKLGLRFFKLTDSVRCSPVTLIDLIATGTLTVTDARVP
jgi:hypothetical protein